MRKGLGLNRNLEPIVGAWWADGGYSPGEGGGGGGQVGRISKLYRRDW